MISAAAVPPVDSLHTGQLFQPQTLLGALEKKILTPKHSLNYKCSYAVRVLHIPVYGIAYGGEHCD